MGNSKQRKGHKEKLQQRKLKLQHEKNRAQKMQKEFLMNLIKQEQAKGMFDNNPTISPTSPSDSPINIEGPSF